MGTKPIALNRHCVICRETAAKVPDDPPEIIAIAIVSWVSMLGDESLPTNWSTMPIPDESVLAALESKVLDLRAFINREGGILAYRISTGSASHVPKEVARYLIHRHDEGW